MEKVKYIVGDIVAVANVYRPLNSTIITLNPDVDQATFGKYLASMKVQGLLYNHRGRIVVIPYPISTDGLDSFGTINDSIPVSFENNSRDSRLTISKPPRFVNTVGTSSKKAPFLDEITAIDYQIYSQDFSGYVPDSYIKVWLTTHPEFNIVETTTSIQSITGSLSDSNFMFIILIFAMLMVVFLASKSRNWFQYHD